MVTSEGSSKPIEDSQSHTRSPITDLNGKLLDIRKAAGIIAYFLLSPLSTITNPEHSSQFKIVKDSNSNKVINLFVNTKKLLPYMTIC